MIDPSHVAIGKIVKAQGLHGELKVAVYSGDPDNQASFHDIFLGNGRNLQHYRLLKSRRSSKFAIFQLAEIVDRNGAEALIGQEVFVLKSQLPPLAPDEFYWHEIVGLKVITDQGQDLGTVTSMIATGAHDIMVVTGLGHEEYLIPVVQEIIVRQDREGGVLVVAPTPGLLEMNSPDAI
jgi:16S rRNA processing protein RimM